MFFGCQKWPEPEYDPNDWVPPSKTQDTQFWTIGRKTPTDMRNISWRHIMGTSPDSIVPGTTIRYVRAVVVSSDEGGNFYKSMVIQDTTGGISVQIDMTGLHAIYPVGQKVVLIPNGLVVGDYNNLLQVGWIYNQTQVGRINSLYIDKYIKRDGQASLSNLPKPLTNNQIDFSSPKDVNKLVRLENITFQDEAFGKPFAFNEFNTDWKIYVPLANGTEQEVTVRTSNFAKFRSMLIEDKKYNLTGILSIYRTTYQLIIRTKDDIVPLASPPPGEIITYDFATNPFLWQVKWSNESLLIKDYPWQFGTNVIRHIGNFREREMDDWFISPVINYSDIANGYLHFEHQLDVRNAEYEAYQVFYTTSTAITFNSTDWKPLGTLTSFPSSYEWSNSFPLSVIGKNNFRIAIRYNAPNTNVETYAWYIRKIEIRNK
jgi:hypothetical protein